MTMVRAPLKSINFPSSVSPGGGVLPSKRLLRMCRIFTSLRSKRFCGFSEQKKTEERDFDNFAAQEMGKSEKMERGGRGEGIMEQKME